MKGGAQFLDAIGMEADAIADARDLAEQNAVAGRKR